MERSSAASSGIVREVLTRENYEEWKTLMRNYLIGKNLWDVVAGSGSASTELEARRMNGEALHIIQLSCGSHSFDQIKDFETAQRAWNHLAALYGSPFKAQPHISHGVVSDNVSEHKALYEFVEKGDWKGASSYLRDKPDSIFWTAASGRTVLHVATMEGHLKIVEGLVNLGKEKLVEMQDEDGFTALALAACYSGDVHIAKRIVNGVGDNKGVLTLPNKKGEIPLLLAADSGHIKMTRFLFFKTPSHVFHQRNRVLLLERCIHAHMFDVALKMLTRYPQLLMESLPYGFGGLHELARLLPGHLSSSLLDTIVYNLTNGSLLHFLWIMIRTVGKFLESKVTKRPNKRKPIFGHKIEVLRILRYYKDSVAKFDSTQLQEASVFDAMLDAAKYGKYGNVEFLNAMWEANHDLLRAVDNHGRDIFSYAVLRRKQNVFQFVYSHCGNKDVINYRTDMFDNNLLHLAARLGPLSDLNLRPGAALQMQREIQWFKAVEEVVHPKCGEAKNDEGKKPGEIFIETHLELMKEGERWAKETAQTFAIVGVLVITVMFAAIFTVPGGYDQETGLPIYINEKSFTIFIVADVISLFASITAVLIYLDIQTSRYAETDFLLKLPTRIMSGLWFLSLSLVFMMITFCAALAIVLQKSWVYKHLFVDVAILAGLPFILLGPSQLRLLLEFFQSITANPLTYRQKKPKQNFIKRILRSLLLFVKACQR